MRISDWSSDVCSSDLTGTRVTERLLSHAKGGIGDVRLIQPAAEAETRGRQQSAVLSGAVLAGHLAQQRLIQKFALQQPCIETRQRAGIAMAVGCRLRHASPFRFVTTAHDGRWIVEGPDTY